MNCQREAFASKDVYLQHEGSRKILFWNERDEITRSSFRAVVEELHLLAYFKNYKSLTRVSQLLDQELRRLAENCKPSIERISVLSVGSRLVISFIRCIN